jgi:hypothetical protein
MIMKRLVLFVASLMLTGSTGMALAQYDTLAVSTPVASSTPAFKSNPQVKEIADRIKLQEARITAAMSDGKLLAGPGEDLRKKLSAIRLELQVDIRQNRKNGQQGLTGDQIQQLNSELNENLTALRQDKHDIASPANP